MFVLLPPSETKAVGGGGPVLDLKALIFPGLATARTAVIDSLTALCTDLPAARTALSVTASKDQEIIATARLRQSPTMPALSRYTGVLYEAFDAPSLPRAARERATARVLITSALFGMVGGGDAVPAYRLSAGSVLPGFGGLAAFWRNQLTASLASMPGPIVDLRSGAYAGFARLPDAITVRVLTQDGLGRRTVVSHFNKATKGLVARALMLSRADIDGISAVIRIVRRAGLQVERTGELSLDVIT